MDLHIGDNIASAALAILSPRFRDSHGDLDDHTDRTYEKEETVSEILLRFPQFHPQLENLRLFDAGIGSGIVMASMMKEMRTRFPLMPYLYAGRELDPGNASEALGKLPEYLARDPEHPEDDQPFVFALTNMTYGSGAPWLAFKNQKTPKKLRWKELALEADTLDGIKEEFRQLQSFLTDHWQVKRGANGNLLPEEPTVLVIFRKSQHNMLKGLIPAEGGIVPGYDRIIASQPYRARAAKESIAQNTMLPLAEALLPGGALTAVHACNESSVLGNNGLPINDPRSVMKIIEGVWPGSNPLPNKGIDIFDAVHELLSENNRARLQLRFEGGRRSRDGLLRDTTLFEYGMKPLPDALVLEAAYKAAVYAAQIEHHDVMAALENGSLLTATRNVLAQGGLRFYNELYQFVRQGPV